MANGGWIKIHRSMLDWEWYGDINTMALFLHLLLIANFEDKRERGRMVHRGQVWVTVAQLSDALRQTTRQTRTALEHLKTTNEIAIQTTNAGTLITVVNYDKYQCGKLESDKPNDKPDDKQTTNERQTNRQAERQTNDKPSLVKRIKEIKKLRREEEDRYSVYIDTTRVRARESDSDVENSPQLQEQVSASPPLPGDNNNLPTNPINEQEHSSVLDDISSYLRNAKGARA